ncbi:hypothetical protein KUTeg_001439 [Tegillarca granosa]|uniref:SSD domain-containing protein n=1 Tax=Tegillarca granosa TaxID=220873 RepID=A0ABQ9FRE7_TEGGR|nr:hypothetical protein KUTeg_001439 [Tegillarca granosa]
MTFFSSQSEVQYNRVPLNDNDQPDFPDTDDELLQCEYVDETSQCASNGETSTPAVLLSNNFTCCQSLCNVSHKRSVGIGIFLSLLALVAFSSVLTGLGYYSLFIKTPLPYIDKSYHAFAIPNHKSSLNYEAFTAARSKNLSHSFQLHRFKRHINNKKLPLSENDEKLSTYWGSIKRQLNFKHNSNDLFRVNNPGDESRDLLIQKRSVHDADENISRDIKKRSSDMISVVAYQYHVRWKMQVVFMATGSDNEPEHEKHNIFTAERLHTIHNIEKSILNHPEFKDFCFKDRYVYQSDPALKSIYGCAPLNSLMTYFFPSQDSSGKFHYDGLGSNMAEIESAIKLAMTSDHFYYFVDEKVNKTYHKSRLLRTEVLFGAPLRGYSNPYVKSKEQTEKFKSFVIKYIDILSKASTDKVQVLFGGNEIFDYEVDNTFWNDLRLAIISAASIAVFMMILTSSLWLTLWGIVSICLSFPLAFFFYRVVCGIRALGILNGVAAFVIIGIGVDDVFVFVNIYRQSSPDLTTCKRIKHTLVTAGKATFFTSFTTSAAFAANIASSIPAVHQFGLFMSLIVASCWVTVVMIMPPALFLWQYTFARCESYLMSMCAKPFKHRKIGVKDLPCDIAQFVRGTGGSGNSDNTVNNENRLQTTTTCTDVGSDGQNNTENDDDDDLPLLMLEDPMEYYFQGHYDTDDVPLLTGDDSTFQQVSSQSNSLMHAGNEVNPSNILQSFVYYFIACPVVKVKWIILVLSVILLAISIGLTTLLHPATKPPQFFNRDTNLQKLLDLKANFSVIDEISCSKCSAVYDVPASDLHVGIPVTHTPYIPTKSFDRETHKHSHMPTIPSFFFSKITTDTVKSSKHVTKKPKTMIPPWKIPPVITKSQLTSTKRPDLKAKTTTTVKTNPPPHVEKTTTPKPFIDSNPYHTLNTERQTTRPLIITPPKAISESRSVPQNVNLCDNNDCTKTQDRPLLETGATVYVVFGIKGVDKSDIEVGHVMDQSVTTSKGQSYFSAFHQYIKWEKLIQDIKATVLKDSPHLGLDRMICLVLGIFYMVGWEIGGVEAVSLSILVGSSVDYCMHLVEGYLIAGKAVPYHCKEVRMTDC